MDGRGRLAQPLKRPGPSGPTGRPNVKGAERRPRKVARASAYAHAPVSEPSRLGRLARHWLVVLEALQPPRWAGIIASAFLILAAVGYGVLKGDHLPVVFQTVKDAGDVAA